MHASVRRLVAGPLLITIVASTLIGGLSGEMVARASDADRVAIGNTGGTLSAVIQVGGALIVVGGGDSRSDLADLVGRSTVPWRRHIDLLILPGWDDQQPIGALGLLERGGAAQIVIAGQPADTPVWTALQQLAARDGIPISIVNGRNVADVAPDVRLSIVAGQPSAASTAEFAITTLKYHQTVLTLLDASNDGLQAMKAGNIALERSHILAEMRPVSSVPAQTDVLFQPRASAASDLSGESTTYLGEITSGQRVTIRLIGNELRFPLDAVMKAGASTLSPPSSVTSP